MTAIRYNGTPCTGEIFSALSHTDSNTDTQALKIVHGISTGAISVDKKIPDSVVTFIKKD